MEQSVYTLTDLLIDIGGISRAVVTIGLFLTHFTALHLFKASLVQNLFMMQQEDHQPHPKYLQFLKESRTTASGNDVNAGEE